MRQKAHRARGKERFRNTLILDKQSAVSWNDKLEMLEAFNQLHGHVCVPSRDEECRAVQVARAFFQAATKLSDDNEDILPQVWDKHWPLLSRLQPPAPISCAPISCGYRVRVPGRSAGLHPVLTWYPDARTLSRGSMPISAPCASADKRTPHLVWQEDGVDQKLSVFHLFSELFPEYANDKDRDGGNTGTWQRCVAVAAAGGELSRDAEIESRD